MSLILTVKARKSRLESVTTVALQMGDIQRGVSGQVSARRGARFITTIRTVAKIIVYCGEGDFDRGVGDAREGRGVFVELGN
jgi:hypothetical protein